jgi:hypothetical protein
LASRNATHQFHLFLHLNQNLPQTYSEDEKFLSPRIEAGLRLVPCGLVHKQHAAQHGQHLGESFESEAADEMKML